MNKTFFSLFVCFYCAKVAAWQRPHSKQCRNVMQPICFCTNHVCTIYIVCLISILMLIKQIDKMFFLCAISTNMLFKTKTKPKQNPIKKRYNSTLFLGLSKFNWKRFWCVMTNQLTHIWLFHIAIQWFFSSSLAEASLVTAIFESSQLWKKKCSRCDEITTNSSICLTAVKIVQKKMVKTEKTKNNAICWWRHMCGRETPMHLNWCHYFWRKILISIIHLHRTNQKEKFIWNNKNICSFAFMYIELNDRRWFFNVYFHLFLCSTFFSLLLFSIPTIWA